MLQLHFILWLFFVCLMIALDREGFASIVEPLMPAVANIYTKQNVEHERQGPVVEWSSHQIL